MEKGINTQKDAKSFNRRYYEGFCDMIGKIDKGTIRPDERITLTIGELKILFDENATATLEIATNELDKNKGDEMYKITLTEIIKDKNAVIHTPSEKQNQALREELHKRELKWRVGSSYIEYLNYETYENETCINPCLGLYGDIDGAKALRFTIYEFKEVDLTK